MAEIIDGRALAQQIKDEVKKEIEGLGFSPGLAVVLIGSNWESKLYIKQKQKACSEVGINFNLHELGENVCEEDIIRTINNLNEDQSVHGIIVQLPIRADLNLLSIQETVNFGKDVDGFNSINRGLLFTTEKNLPSETMVPCTPQGCIKLIESTGVDINGKHAVVVGRSNIAGKPLSYLLLQKDATVTICHSQTRNLSFYTKQADIIVTAVGSPRLITSSMIKKGAIVIDIGINRIDGKLVGDVDFDSVKNVVSYITPVPGGVGPMTVACLLQNILKATYNSRIDK